MKTFFGRKLTIVLMGAAVLLGSLFAFAPAVFADSTYTIQPNDTLGSIAVAHSVTVQSIVTANPHITNPDVIVPGTTITIPSANLAPGENVWSGYTAPGAVPVTGATATTAPGATAVPATGATATPVPAATSTTPYTFASPTNECGWGVNDGHVKYGKLYVSPGFNLNRWLRFHPNLPFSVLAPLNPGLIDGPQFECKVIILPSM
jgi:LysM repeat protein